MEPFLASTGAVALAEIGDKTQLLAFALAGRFRAPLPIILGIAVATLLNHAAAAALGSLAPWLFSPEILRWVVAATFLAMAAWLLIPDRLDGADDAPSASAAGPFVATLVCFFLVEIGDKTQIATSLLAARYDALLQVVAGTTLGMMLVNAPTVLLGDRLSMRLPLPAIRIAAAALFAALGVAALFIPMG
ncbi:MAG: TMEM165/GDT1 family protein [Alphaproteobacteria bacterium]|nr:TMEM165/GDT1 family protein [Alphaproteobacteria bacterium]